MFTDQTADEYLTVAEAAARVKLSETTIRRHIRIGVLQTRRFGARSIRIRASELERLADQNQAPATEIAHPGLPGAPLPTDFAEHVRRLVNNAPPLTPAQLSRLSALLGGSPE